MSFTRFLNNSAEGPTNGFSRFINKPQDQYDTTKIQKQIDNANTRIQDAGYKPQDGDRRNWFEKATNLPQKQNWFFDALELLGRPAQAVMNVVDKQHDGTEGVAQAAWRGFSGKDRIRGTELAGNLGVDNGFARFLTGTALEIGLDPTTYIPVGVLAKGVKSSAGMAIKPIKAGYDALEAVSPALKTFRETKLAPAAESVKDGLGYMFKPGYKQTETLTGEQSDTLKNLASQTENSRRYLQGQYMDTLTSTAKDVGLDKGSEVGRIMEKPLRGFEDIKGYEFPDGMTRTTEKQDLFNAIGEKRGEIKGLSKDIRSKTVDYQKAIGEFAGGINATDNEIKKIYMGLERQAGKNLDKSTRENLRNASTEIARIESQVNALPDAEKSLLNQYKKMVRENHEATFDLAKQIRKTAPNGISGVTRDEIPSTLHNWIRSGGKGIDEVADELGYSYSTDMLRQLEGLHGLPRKLDNDTVERMARMEMERSGALKHLADTNGQLEATKQTLMKSIQDIQKSAPVTRQSKATEQAFADLSANPRYKELTQQRSALKSQLDALRGESKQMRQAKLDQIKSVEDEISAIHESARNPIIMQKEIERPVRDVPTDPKVQQAAKKLMETNSEIRNLAAEKGISISELEGYMAHILSTEERNLRKVIKPKSLDSGSFNIGNPNKSILNERKYKGLSAEDVNDLKGRKVFEDNAFFATAVGQQRLIDYIHAVDFRRQVLSNREFARPFVKGMEIPKNAEVIDSNNYTFLKDTGDVIDGVVQTEKIGGQYVVTKAAKQLLDRYQRINSDEGTKAFLKAVGAAQGMWKKLALFSPGFHVRNAAGAWWNMYAAGMNTYNLVRYTTSAVNDLVRARQGEKVAMIDEFKKQGLHYGGLTQTEYGEMFKEPEKVIERKVRQQSMTTGERVKDAALHPFETSRAVGEKSDSSMKYAMYKWAREKLNLSPEKAADKVKEALFDYSDLTPFEQKARILIPFYSWSRKNIPFQVKRFIEDPRKFANLNKTRLNAQGAVGIDEQNQPEYMKENLSIPVYGKGGKGKLLGLNLPAGDLTKLSSPLKTLTDGITPLLKTPIELASNYNLFRGKSIQKFEGQEKQYQLPGTGIEFGIPIKTAYALEQATGQVGRNATEFLQKPENVDQDNKFRAPSFGISSMVKDFDAAKNAYFQKLQELKQLQDLMLYIQQQEGAKPRTLAEIKNGAR